MNGNGWHKLKRNHGNEGPENLVSVYSPLVPLAGDGTFDTAVSDYGFRCGFAMGCRRKNGEWYGKDEIEFTNEKVFWAWLQKWSRKKSPVWIYSFGWSEQSRLLGLWNELDEGRIKLTIDPEDRKVNGLAETKKPKGWKGLCCIEDKPFIVTGVGPKGTYKFCDILNYLPISLDQLIKSDKETLITSFSSDAGNALLLSQAKLATIAIHNCVTNLMALWQSEDRGVWQATVGRLALSNYRHSFIDERVVVHKPSIPKEIRGNKRAELEHIKEQPCWLAKLLERKAYIGGEIRHWFNGSTLDRVHHIDVTGHYASIMRDCKLPYKLVAYSEKDDCYGLGERYGWRNCIADIVIETNTDTFPVRRKPNIRWPIGIYGTQLCGAELERAAKDGCIKRVGRIACYLCDYVCRDFANYWIQQRAKCEDIGDFSGSMLAKSMLVALPGKFGSLGNKWQMRESQYCPDRWGTWAQWDKREGKICEYRAVAEVAQCSCERGERYDSFVCLPAFVCSEGREKIRQFRLTLPSNSVYLQQTDSFLLTGDGYGEARGWEGFNSGQAGSWRDHGEYDGLTVWNANCWQAGESPQGQRVRECYAGLTTNRRAIDYTKWRIRTGRCAGEAIIAGPMRTVARKESIAEIRSLTGDYGHFTDGWSCGPLREMADLCKDDDLSYSGENQDLSRLEQQLHMFGYSDYLPK